MFQQKSKKIPPPRPPPPNFLKYKSKSTYNLNQGTPNLIDWSPPSSPKGEHSGAFGGSVSSSYSSSTSSLTSSKRSLENDVLFPTAIHFLNSTNVQSQASHLKPRIIRAVPPKKNVYSRDESAIDGSPPMPKGPPPSPPKGHTEVVTPYGIALFDFPATQHGDLPLQVNDVVVILRRVNEEWLYGKVSDKEGMFPENFINIEVPLPNDSQILTALYEFKPQEPGDLPLRAGQKVKILKIISNDWLYGESDGWRFIVRCDDAGYLRVTPKGLQNSRYGRKYVYVDGF